MLTSNAHVRIVPWTGDDFLNSRCEWQRLLAASEADPLFLSWDWQSLWWRTFGAPRQRELMVLAAYRSDELIGIAPFYRKKELRKGLIPVRSLQLLGLSWRDPDDLISEYLDIVVGESDYGRVRTAFLDFIEANEYGSEVVIGATDRRRGWPEALRQRLGASPGIVREIDGAASYQADLSSGFDEYLRALGASTRRRLWNLRTRLGELGPVSLRYASVREVESALHELNRLHATRWGEPVFSGRRWQFHLDFARGAAQRGELRLSRLVVGQQTVCVLYDIRIGQRQYNVQMGFDPQFARNLSLGLLHLGYAMEAAADAGVTTYDFLAGPGRATDYKDNLSQQTRQLNTVQYVRGTVLSSLYRWHDRRRRAHHAQ